MEERPTHRAAGNHTQVPAATPRRNQTATPYESPRTKRNALLALALIAAAFYVLNLLTPEAIDDYAYKFVFQGDAPDYGQPVATLGDIAKSQYEHYFTWNGRSLIHTLVQAFTGIAGKGAFNVCNTAVFALLIILLCRFYGKRPDAGTITLVTALFVLLMPSFGATQLWMTGSINYQWAAAAAIAFLLLLHKRGERPIKAASAPLLLVGILCGWTHEGIVFPLCVGLAAYFLTRIKTIVKSEGILLIAGFAVGAAICGLSPGTLGRSGIGTPLTLGTIALKIFSGLTVLSKLRAIYLLLIGLGLLAWRDKARLRAFLGRHTILCFALLGGLLLLLMSEFTAARAGYGMDLCALLLLLRLMAEEGGELRQLSPYWPALAALLTAFYAGALFYNVQNYKTYRALAEQLRRTDNGYVLAYDEAAVPRVFSSFLMRPLTVDAILTGVWNKSIAAVYGRDSLVVLPTAFLSDAREHPEHYAAFSDLGGKLPFYALHTGGDRPAGHVVFRLRKPERSEIPFYYRPFAERLARYSATSIDASDTGYVTVDGQNFLLAAKNSNIEWRVSGVELVE